MPLRRWMAISFIHNKQYIISGCSDQRHSTWLPVLYLGNVGPHIYKLHRTAFITCFPSCKWLGCLPPELFLWHFALCSFCLLAGYLSTMMLPSRGDNEVKSLGHLLQLRHCDKMAAVYLLGFNPLSMLPLSWLLTRLLIISFSGPTKLYYSHWYVLSLFTFKIYFIKAIWLYCMWKKPLKLDIDYLSVSITLCSKHLCAWTSLRILGRGERSAE